MSFATANRAALYRVKEVTWGITPANPALTSCRYTGESLDDNIKKEASKEIRSDRQTTDLITVDDSPGGDFNFEMSYGTFKDLIESALMTTYAAAINIVGVAGDISTTLAVSPLANLTSTTANKFLNVVQGQWIKLAGFANPGNNGFFQVTKKIDNQNLGLNPTPAAAETPAGAAATIKSSGMGRNGVTEQSYTLVKILNDATVATRHNFTGQRVSGMSLDMKTGSLLTGKFSFKGQAASYSTAAFAGETYPAASTTTILNSVTNVQNIWQNGANIGATGSVMSLSLSIDNQHREQKGIGVLGNVGVVAGSLMVKFTAQQYFESSAQALLFKNSTAFAFSFQLSDSAGNMFIVTAPFCKYDSFKENASQLNSDVMAQTTFQALLDPITLCMIQVDFFDGP